VQGRVQHQVAEIVTVIIISFQERQQFTMSSAEDWPQSKIASVKERPQWKGPR
jgi:hypothetical protein